MLSFDRLTVKAGEALQGAAEEACRREAAEIDGAPLLHVLLEEEVEDGSTIRVSLMPGNALQVQFEHTHEGVEEGLLQPA